MKSYLNGGYTSMMRLSPTAEGKLDALGLWSFIMHISDYSILGCYYANYEGSFYGGVLYTPLICRNVWFLHFLMPLNDA